MRFTNFKDFMLWLMVIVFITFIFGAGLHLGYSDGYKVGKRDVCIELLLKGK